MSSYVIGKRNQNLYRVLARARRAWWKTAVWTTLLAALVSAALVVAGLWVVAWWAHEPGRILFGVGSTSAELRWVVFATAGSAVLLGIGIAALTKPSLLQFARRLDSRLGQAQRLSTAYEVLEAGGPVNVVSLALLEDVEERSEHLDARPAGRSGTLRPLLHAAAAAAVLGLAALLIPVPDNALRALRQSSSSTVPMVPGAAEAATVSELASVLDLVAERAQNDYLRAVAGSFADFSERLSKGEVSGAEAARTSEELATHLIAAARDVGGTFQQAIERSLGGTLAESASSEALRDVTLGTESVSGGEAPEPGGAASDIMAGESPPSIYMAFEKVIADYEYDPSSLGMSPNQANRGNWESEADFYGGVLNAEADPNAVAPEAPFAGRVQGEGGGEVAGAAERSSDGAGDAAGAGGAELGAGAASPTGATPQDTAIAALPRNENADGEFTEVELLPAQSDGAVRLVLQPSAPAAFTRAPESSSGARGISGSYKDVVARYFTPASGSPGVGR